MIKHLIIILFQILMALTTLASNVKPIATIPFRMAGSYIVVKVSINNSSPLNLILDTGIRNTIISELSASDSILFSYAGMHNLQGIGTGTPINALVSYNNYLRAGKIKLYNRSVYVLENDIFNFTRQTGTKINGLLGLDFFQDYTIKIDYVLGEIKFYNKEYILAPKGYEMLPMTVENDKMYIQLSLHETDTTYRKVKMLIDSGAQLVAWFHNKKTPAVTIPIKNIRGIIGQGISGEVSGTYCRVNQLCMANFCVNNPIVVFPDSAAIARIISTSNRDGTIGSKMLSRFNIIIDFPNKRFLCKPNAGLKKTFRYNIAGIEVSQIIPDFPQTEVVNVWEKSPAYLAGVKKGDQIMEINGIKSYELTIQEQINLFEMPSKKPMKLIIYRNGTNMEVNIDMKSKL